MRVAPPTALGLAGLLAGAGVTHFSVPAFYDAMIPELLPGPARAWTYGAGAAELAVSAAILAPPTRRKGGLAAALLFAAVLPGNVTVAIAARKSDSSAYRAVTILRLPMQLPLIAWGVYVSRNAR